MQTAPVSSSRSTPAFPPLPSEPESDPAELQLLSAPEATPPGDGLTLMLLLVERAAQQSMNTAETRIGATRKELKAELDDYLAKLADALRQAKEAKDHGGFFSNLLGSIAKILGKVLGPILEHGIEIAKLPGEVVISVTKSVVNNQNVLDGLAKTASELVHEGGISKDIQGFTEGVVRFAAELTQFIGTVHLAVARAALTGGDVGELISEDAERLTNSLKANILENPHFMAVASAVAKGASVAAMVCTAGAATPLVIAGVVLLGVSELDRQTGLIEQVVGEQAAPYVRLGVQLAGACCFLVAGGAADQSVQLLQRISAGLDGGLKIYAGVRTIIEGHRAADAIDKSAETLRSLQSIQQLQRLLQTLLQALEEKSEDRTKTRELGSDLVATHAATERALIPA